MSLIEVTLVIGIISFAVVPMVGLLAIGCQGYQSALEKSVEASILQHVRGLGSSLQSVGDRLPEAWFTVDGMTTPEGSADALYVVRAESAEKTLASGQAMATLASRYHIVHLPSGQTNSSGVIHVTPR
jgi:hypothetical protein